MTKNFVKALRAKNSLNRLIRSSAKLIFRDKHKETFKAMLDAKDPLYMKRSIGMIINWEKESYSEEIVHIHGTEDHTIPLRNVNADFVIETGSHMMTLTNSEPINAILVELLY